jgi:hypothetical protein
LALLKSKFKNWLDSLNKVPASGLSTTLIANALNSIVLLLSAKVLKKLLLVLTPCKRCGGAALVAMALKPTQDFKLDSFGFKPCE